MAKVRRWGLEILAIILGLIWLSPFYLMIVNAFKTKLEIFDNTLKLPANVTFQNFKDAFEQLSFYVHSLIQCLYQ